MCDDIVTKIVVLKLAACKKIDGSVIKFVTLSLKQWNFGYNVAKNLLQISHYKVNFVLLVLHIRNPDGQHFLFL